jgi:N-acetylmuramoyl-L-alanine amidase
LTYYIDETLNDTEFTPAGSVQGVFGVPRRYESITIHHWGSFGQTHDGVVDFFVNRNQATSAHFVASDNRIHCLVSPQDSAWAAGNAYGNATSIHIEARPEGTDGDYATVAWLVSFLRAHYGENLPLKAHREWSATACPGTWDLARVDRMAREAAGTSTPVPAPSITLEALASTPTPGFGQFRVDPGDTLSGIAVQFGWTLESIIAANPGINPDRIWPGQILQDGKAPYVAPAPAGLPPYCFVDAGDTLGGIAVQYGVSLNYILSRNPGINPNLIYPGQRVNL